MGKKKIIITQNQLNEICGNNSTYLDGLALTPDLGNIYSTEVTTNGSVDDAYPDPTTTDDYASDSTNNVRGYFGLRGMGSVSTLREMTKCEWEKMVFNEDNQRLKYRTFGATNDSEGKSYDATKKNISRLNIAQRKLKTGNQEEKQKAAKTIERMKKNWKGIDIASKQYDTAKKIDKEIKPSIKSSPKNSGNGKAHSPKTPENGVFLN